MEYRAQLKQIAPAVYAGLIEAEIKMNEGAFINNILNVSPERARLRDTLTTRQMDLTELSLEGIKRNLTRLNPVITMQKP